MGYGTDLWDNFGGVAQRTDDGLTGLKDASKFYKAVATMELEFGKNLQKLCRATYKETFNKKRNEAGTNREAWETCLREMEAIAAHHISCGTDIGKNVCDPLNEFIKTKERTRKQYLSEGMRLTKDLESGYANLAKVKNNYHKTAKSAEQAQTLYSRADADPNFSVMQVEKVQAKSQSQAAKAQAADTEYQQTIDITNRLQHDFYTNLFPKVLDDLQVLDEERIDQFQMSTRLFVQIHDAILPNITTNFQTIAQAVEMIDHSKDTQLFINENISDKPVPGDIQYEPASFIAQGGGGGGGGGPTRVPGTGTQSRGDQYSTMNPKQLQAALEDVKKNILVQQKTKSGIETLIACYGEGTEAKRQVQQQINDCEEEIANLTSKQREIEGLLGIGGGGDDYDEPGPIPAKGGNKPPQSAGASSQLYATALYAYEAQGDGELSFEEGEKIAITSQDDSGWWTGTLKGKTGLVPMNYLTTD